MRFRCVAVGIAAVSVALLILAKVFIYPDCFSFDANDDANHAFPGLHVARAALREGELPTLNVYNNFGAPLLGDGLTYPFAVQAITYGFLDGPYAMTVNRFIIAILTVVGGFLFFRIYLAPLSAVICAILAFFNPVAFWYPVHQYQMATPLFFFTFYALSRLHRRRSARWFAVLVVMLCVLTLSVSINHVVMMIPFLVTWEFCRHRFRANRYSIAAIVALAAAAVFSYPQTAEFARSFGSSARAGEGVYDSILTTGRELFLGLIIPPAEWIAYNYGAQLQVTSYLSMGVLLMIPSAAWLIRRKALWKQTSLFFCGVVPTIIALALYVNPAIRFSIPLIRAVDISRVLWFSLPFCYVYIGYFVSYARHTGVPAGVAALLLIGSVTTVAAIHTMPETVSVSALHSVILLLVAAAAVAFFRRRGVPAGRSRRYAGSPVGSALVICSLALTPVPVIFRVLGLNTGMCMGTQYSANLDSSRFEPQSLVPLMAKGHRLATELHTRFGQDLRIASHGILGSDARGIVIDKAFGARLASRHLVTVDQIPYGYFFSHPWQPDELTRLGIRYLLVPRLPDPELDHDGWTRLGAAGGFSLYENPARPTPVYTVDAAGRPVFIHDYALVPNGVRVNLPAEAAGSMIVVTLTHRPGFAATIDGRSTAVVERDGFVAVKTRPGDRQIEVRHHPYSWYHVAAGIIIASSISVLYAFYAFGNREQRRQRCPI